MIEFDPMTSTPLEKALVTLREDLTLQVACGDHALDVQLDAGMALDLARALLANVNAQEPWTGRADANVLARANDSAFVLLGAVTAGLKSGEVLSPEDCLAASALLERAFVASSLLEEALTEGAPQTADAPILTPDMEKHHL